MARRSYFRKLAIRAEVADSPARPTNALLRRWSQVSDDTYSPSSVHSPPAPPVYRADRSVERSVPALAPAQIGAPQELEPAPARIAEQKSTAFRSDLEPSARPTAPHHESGRGRDKRAQLTDPVRRFLEESPIPKKSASPATTTAQPLLSPVASSPAEPARQARTVRNVPIAPKPTATPERVREVRAVEVREREVRHERVVTRLSPPSPIPRSAPTSAPPSRTGPTVSIGTVEVRVTREAPAPARTAPAVPSPAPSRASSSGALTRGWQSFHGWRQG